MDKPYFIIGIDPDLHKSGVAITENKQLIICESMYIWKVFRILEYYTLSLNLVSHLVVIEDGNLGRSANWHGGGKRTAGNVGKNQAIATILREFCECHKINHKCVPPAGYSRLFDDEKLFRRTTGWKEKTNKDARSACAIIWNY